MPIKANKFLYTLQDEVEAHGIYHAHSLFPFCDVFHFHQKSRTDLNFDSSFPMYWENKEAILKYFGNIATTHGWKETLHDLLYVKATKKGFHLPTQQPTIIFCLHDKVKLLTSKSRGTLRNCMAIYDYQLYPFKQRGIVPTWIGDTAKPLGNMWAHCLHLEEGQEIFYATYS
tara:strand:- start:431 stop:946 length:516 start_codon:yes stop_codon:yes gene_type:complete